VIRSDAGDAHRLSLSARVLSTMLSQVKAKPAAAEALLTSMKTTLQRCIWPLRIAAATGPRAIILRARKAASRRSVGEGDSARQLSEQGGWDECYSPVAG
jgi:hypothetical protein